MLRQILAVVGGFVLWSVLWLLLGQALAVSGLLPSSGQPVTAPAPLTALLIGSVALSVLAGYVAATISRTPGYKVAVALGLVLLVVGIAVQAQYWQLMPVWYHLVFLVFLVPACIAGARLRTRRVDA